MERFKHFDVKNGHLHIGGLDCADIIKEFGTPCYVMDAERIENTYKAFINAFLSSDIKGGISYASKAFSCKEIYRIMKSLNAYVDVVSGGELFTALSVDFPAEKVFFHGNGKTSDEIEFAVKNKVGIIVIDSYDEALFIDKIAAETKSVQNVMIRINPGIEAHTHHYVQTAKIDSKFGFSIYNGEAEKIVNFVAEKPNLNLVGLHCHIGSQIFEQKSFVLAAKKTADFYAEIKSKYDITLEKLNLGGGFGVWYYDGDKHYDYIDYTNAVREILSTVKNEFNERDIAVPEVFFEPGRSIVAESGITLYKVNAVKNIPDIKTYLAVDGGMFDNPRYALYQARYTVICPLKMEEPCDTKYTVAGKCCESGDIIAEDVFLPKTVAGDYLCVLTTGAYNYSMASNYNRNLIPPVVFVKNGKAYYAVKKQSYEDLVRNDV